MPINTFPQVLNLGLCPREQSNSFKIVRYISLQFSANSGSHRQAFHSVSCPHIKADGFLSFMPFYKPLSQTHCFLSLAPNISLKDSWGPCLRSDLAPLMFSSAESHSISPCASAPPHGNDKEQRDCTFLIQGLNQYPCHKQGQAISFRRERSLLCRHTQ